ncbi:methyltransferase domain-containing protein [Sarocladium implicatum]|nr:methyltransferase domain-containing protein [Sarocladium implicatum]
MEEIPERLDEQHVLTTRVLGFLVHPSITLDASSTLKVADVGAGSGAWLLDLARKLPLSCQLKGFDVSSSALPSAQELPANVSFTTQDMFLPFPAAELGTYDLVAARFISSAATKAEWQDAVRNLMTLLKPGGWIQWIDSSNFALYKTVPGTSSKACQSIYDGLEPLRAKDDLIIGLMMRHSGNLRREDVLQEIGLVEVHEDVFSTDRLQDPELEIRDKGTRNILTCFLGCLEGLIGADGHDWSAEKIERLREEAMGEVDRGVYHTLDQVCIIGRKPVQH